MAQDIGAYLEPKRSAALVIDMQNDFCHPEGAFGKRGLNLLSVHEMIPVLARFVDTARSLGVEIVHVRSFLDEKFLSRSMLARNRQLGRGRGICPEGGWGSEFYQMIPARDEMVLTKHAFSAFIGTDLQERLLAKGIQTLMVTGVLTNVCCESTLRDGFMLGFYTFLVEDCCASMDQAAHLATVENVRNYFGWAFKSGDLIPFLQQVRP
ncbi:MAG: isochorismatase family cysteine hydrolase [Syntrophorhabdales bacterium]|jgi:ureidoacrylate peracid hydrolase